MFHTTMIFRMPWRAFFMFSFFIHAAPVFSQKIPSDSVIQAIKNPHQPLYSDENTVDTGKGVSHLLLAPSDSAGSHAKKNDSAGIVLKEINGGSPALPALLNIKEKPAVHTESIDAKSLKTLGRYHRLMGAYDVIGGALTILAGTVLLDKKGASPYAMCCIALGGISIGLGLWEIKVGGKLLGGKVWGK
jgi:hypothetical protein